MGENLIMLFFIIIMFFSNTRWTQLLVPLEILMSKISEKYISIHIYSFVHTRVVKNIKLSSHGFLFHRNINRRAMPNSLKSSTTMRKTKSYIFDVQQKIIKLHKLVKWF